MLAFPESPAPARSAHSPRGAAAEFRRSPVPARGTVPSQALTRGHKALTTTLCGRRYNCHHFTDKEAKAGRSLGTRQCPGVGRGQDSPEPTALITSIVCSNLHHAKDRTEAQRG